MGQMPFCYTTVSKQWRTSSDVTERPWDTPGQLKSCQLLHNSTITPIWKGLKVTQGQQNRRCLIGHVHFVQGHISKFQLVGCSDNISMFAYFTDINTLTVSHDCLRPWEVPSVLIRQLKLQAVCTFQLMFKHDVVNMLNFWSYGSQKGFEKQKWPSRSLKVISTGADTHLILTP